MDNLQTMKTVEILKNLARQWKVTIEFANSEMSATGEPVFRVSISSLDIEIEEPLFYTMKGDPIFG